MDLNTVIPVVLVTGYLVFFVLSKKNAKVAKQQLAAGARLFDVRTPAEFSSGHLPNAVNIPLSDIGSRLRDFGPKEKPIVLYCASGARSAAAAAKLRSAGFTSVFNLGSISNGR